MRSLLALAALSLPQLAGAQEIDQPHTGGRPVTLDLHAGFAWYGNGLALGGRIGIPIVDNGFVKTINNSVYINFGADFYYAEYYNGNNFEERSAALGIPVSMQWNFYFTPEWSAYGEVGVNLYVHNGDFRPGPYWGIGAVGGRYHFGESAALMLRLGSPYSSFGFELSF